MRLRVWLCDGGGLQYVSTMPLGVELVVDGMPCVVVAALAACLAIGVQLTAHPQTDLFLPPVSSVQGGGVYASGSGSTRFLFCDISSNTGGSSPNLMIASGHTSCFSVSDSSDLPTGVASSGLFFPCPATSSSTVDALTSLVANLTATVALLNETLTANVANVATSVTNVASSVADHSAMLSCDASGRRLADTLPDPSSSAPTPAPTAKDVMEEYLARYPEFAATLTDEQRAIIDQHGQDFGLPALATGE